MTTHHAGGWPVRVLAAMLLAIVSLPPSAPSAWADDCDARGENARPGATGKTV